MLLAGVAQPSWALWGSEVLLIEVVDEPGADAETGGGQERAGKRARQVERGRREMMDTVSRWVKDVRQAEDARRAGSESRLGALTGRVEDIERVME